MKKLIALGTVITLMAFSTVTAFASAYNTPAEVAASVTGRVISDVIAERIETGKTYGTIANEAGKLEEFKTANLEMQKANLDEQVAAGRITRAKADEIIAAIEANQVNCDGTGSSGLGRSMGARFGSNGTGQGLGGANRGTGIGGGRWAANN